MIYMYVYIYTYYTIPVYQDVPRFFPPAALCQGAGETFYSLGVHVQWVVGSVS